MNEMTEMTETRHCSSCREPRPADEFYKRRSGRQAGQPINVCVHCNALNGAYRRYTSYTDGRLATELTRLELNAEMIRHIQKQRKEAGLRSLEKEKE